MEFLSTIYDGNPAKPRFIEQMQMGIESSATQYDAGVVREYAGNFMIAFETRGAEETFSIGQPVCDADGNIMGWLGIGLYRNLDYSAEVRVPCEYWQICLPTEYCKVGQKVYTYWQNKEKMKGDEESEV